MDIAIIGAGAAGCFCAIHLKRRIPQANIYIYEASKQPLAKVSVTGGGRCNITNTFVDVENLSQVYPRGEQLMKRSLSVFDQNETMAWFEQEGVQLMVQDDQRVFPKSEDAMEVVNKLLFIMKEEKIAIHLSHQVSDVVVSDNRYQLTFTENKLKPATADFLVITSGGLKQSQFIQSLQLDVVSPVPSLFTFNISLPELTALSGTTIEGCRASIAGTKFRSEGNILITHWGISGPCVLKLSSYAARYLADNNYKAQLIINWLGQQKEEEVRQWLAKTISQFPQKHIGTIYPLSFSLRHWKFLLDRCKIDANQPYKALNSKQFNRIVSTLVNDSYDLSGQSRNKDEFVTCGGIALSSVNLSTLESRQYRHLYFAGEVLDVDAITGGFNLQAAWTTAYVVALAISSELKSNT